MKAFTLAEVLITLTIIGIIAAITIPTITANHRREETLARLKKFYSTLNQVVLKAQADGNNWNYWGEETDSIFDSTSAVAESFAEQYLLPYLIYHKYETKDNMFYIYLNDGSHFYLYKGGCIDFIFDTNGDRKPNKFGRDKFAFLFCPESNTRKSNTILPAYPSTITREEALKNCKSTPYYCSGLVFIDGWQFKKDYPHNI